MTAASSPSDAAAAARSALRRRRVIASRRLRPSPDLLVTVAGSAAFVVAIERASAWHQQAALVAAAGVSGALLARSHRRMATETRLTTRGSMPVLFPLPDRVGSWATNWVCNAVAAGGVWWLLDRDGWWTAPIVFAFAGHLTADVWKPVVASWVPVRIAVRRLRARTEQDRAHVAEREEAEIAWTLANSRLVDEAPLRAWLDDPEGGAPDGVTIEPAVDPADRPRVLRVFKDDGLGSGLRRRLADGDLVVQPEDDGGKVHLTLPDGQELDLFDLASRWARDRGWRAHGATVVTAKVAAGPAVLVVPLAAGIPRKNAMTLPVVLIGAEPTRVPVGSPGDERVRIGHLQLGADRHQVEDRQQIRTIVPGPPVDEVSTAALPKGAPSYEELAAQLGRAAPDADVRIDRSLGIPSVVGTDPGTGRVVRLLPVGRQWAPPWTGFSKGHRVVLGCDALELVVIDQPIGSPDDYDPAHVFDIQ